MIDLQSIKDRLAAATSAPWSDFCESGDWWIQQKDAEGSPTGEVICDANDMSAGNMLFITHAPTDVADLIAEVDQLSALPALITQIEARGWLWEGGHSQGPFEPERRFYARLWLPSLDPMHDDEPWIDERIGWGATIEAATRQAFDALPPDPYGRTDP